MTPQNPSTTRRLRAIHWLPGLALALHIACASAQSGSLAPATGSLIQAAEEPTHGILLPGALPDEHSARHAAVTEFSTLFLASRFAELEKLYAQSIKEEQRLPSGVFKAPLYVSDMETTLTKPPAAFDDNPDVARKAALAHWVQMGALADRWAKAFPKSSGAAVVQSEIIMRQGFVYRGGGYASEVTAADMAKFKQYVEQAYQALAARAAVGQQDPLWHMQMVAIGRQQGWQPEKRHGKTVETAVKAFPYFYDIYFQAALASTPQWGGSAERVEAIASWAADRTQDKEGQSLYARIHWAVSSYFRGDPVRNGKAQWPRLKAGFEDIIRLYPDPWNLNTFAFFACQADDQDTLRRLLTQIGERVDIMAWRSPAVMQVCRTRAK